MPSKSTILATVAIAAAANAHIIMEKPVPFSVDKIDNSPITASQYPCKSQNGFTVSTMNNMKVGELVNVNFKGTAVHGGGSCQLSFTADKTPTANSKFKVVKSIEGGCPGLNGNVNTYNFTLPDSIPNGQVTFAWTWFSKEAGQPELYMNCAPVTVSGGASDTSKMDALPDMLKANINDCKQVENKAIQFPNPGSVVQNGGTNDLAPPTGNCGKSGGSTGGGAGGASSSAGSGGAATSVGGGGGAASSVGGGGAATSVGGGGGAATSAAAIPTSAAGAAPSAPAAASSNTGGVFAPGASSGAGEQPQSTLTTLVTTTATPPAQGTGAPSTPSTGGGSGTCSQNGAIVCNGESQFGICNFGTVVWQPVASGTKCSNGSVQKREYKLRRRNQRPRLVVPGKDFEPGN